MSFVLQVDFSIAQHAPAKAPFPAEQLSRIDKAIADGWEGVPAAWRARLEQDDVMRVCSQFRNKPPKRVAAAIQARAKSGVAYPADGVMGDWRRGEAIAQSGYGLRFTDRDGNRPNGGNCYACHQIDKAEVSYGTLGPSLLGYGRLHDYAPEFALKVYEKIYNSHAATPCSLMPRFGAGKVLTGSDQGPGGAADGARQPGQQ